MRTYKYHLEQLLLHFLRLVFQPLSPLVQQFLSSLQDVYEEGRFCGLSAKIKGCFILRN